MTIVYGLNSLFLLVASVDSFNWPFISTFKSKAFIKRERNGKFFSSSNSKN